ncbi:MAG: ATP-grasp domain-containing protein [Rhodobacteraceae bacterium]|nr:ATP-grasp domain-containing protein [Paracoccaceae bacterium]
MSARKAAIVYVDIDRSKVALYDYRERHFKVARQLGWTCITVTAEGHPREEEIERQTDAFFALPVLSAQSLVNFVLSLKGRFEVKVLFTFPGQTVAGLNLPAVMNEACQALGLTAPAAEAVNLCNNKYAMRIALEKAGIPSARAVVAQCEADLSDAAEKIGFPLIMKPIFGAASALIKKCDDIQALCRHYRLFCSAYNRVSGAHDFGGDSLIFETVVGDKISYEPGKTVMLETYLEGIEATIECAVVDDDPVPLLLHEKLLVSFEESTVLEHLLVVPSTSFTVEQIAEAKAYCCDCVEALGLKRSFVHFEFRMTPDGPRVIEINPRIGGFYVYRSLKDVAGIDPFLTNLIMLSGEDGQEIEARLRTVEASVMDNFHTMFVLYPPSSGRIKAIKGQTKAAQRTGVRAFDITSHRGAITCDTEEKYIAKFWASVPSAEAARQLYDDVKSDLQVEMEPMENQ